MSLVGNATFDFRTKFIRLFLTPEWLTRLSGSYEPASLLDAVLRNPYVAGAEFGPGDEEEKASWIDVELNRFLTQVDAAQVVEKIKRSIDGLTR